MNKYVPHILVLPEDEANRKLADGFTKYHALDERRIQVLPEVGGWNEVVEEFLSKHVVGMRLYTMRITVLLIDQDEVQGRRAEVLQRIPDDLRGRVFVFGSFSDPEALRTSMAKGFQEIGVQLAQQCEEDGEWQHPLLSHNKEEAQRFPQDMKSALFAEKPW